MSAEKRLFFDHEGNAYKFDGLVHGGSRDINGADSQRAMFLVKNGGCALIAKSGSRWRITLRPSIVRLEVLAALLCALAEGRADRIAVSEYDDSRNCWLPSLLGERQHGIAYLAALADAREGGDRPIVSVERDVNDAATKPIVREAYERWHNAPYRLASVLAISERRFGGRFVEVEFADENREWASVRKAGSGYEGHIKNVHREMAHGKRFSFPDRRFEAAVARSYRSALSRKKPVIEDVDAFIFWPAKGYVRERYQRILMPTPSNGALLACVTFDSGINLRRSTG